MIFLIVSAVLIIAMNQLMERIAKLSPVQRELLVRRARERRETGAAVAPALRQRKAGVRVPLSCLQEQLWLHEQVDPSSLAFHIRFTYRLKGQLYKDALEAAIKEVIQRHEALRAYFPVVEGSPVQCFADCAEVHISVERMIPGTALQMETQAQELIAAALGRHFDLSRGPLYRFLLLQMQEDDHLIAFAFHHMVFDGWSCEVFLRELSVAYSAFLSDAAQVDLPKLPVQFGDFALWQREWLASSVLEQQLSFWKNQLADAPHLLDLTTDRPRPRVQTDDGKVEKGSMSAAVSESVRALAGSEGVSLFVLFMAAFNILLYRYCGQDDILVGTPTAGRMRSDLQNLIGVFANMVVFRTRLAGHPTFRELLRQVRQTSIEAISAQDIPFEMVVHAVCPRRDVGATPLFQVAFDVQGPAGSELKLQGLVCTPPGIVRETAAFDLHLTLIDSMPDLGVRMYYRTDLFDPATVARMIKHFCCMVENIVRNPDAQITSLLLEPVTETVNAAEVELPDKTVADCSVLSLFESQVRRNHKKDALVLNEQHFSYDELNDRADALAGHLRSLGVGPEIAVGVSLQRSLNMMVALLGTLKVGGVFVPLDPALPAERLVFMAKDARTKILLAGRIEDYSWADMLPECRLVDFGTRINAIAGWNRNFVKIEPDLDQAAYIVYTSGSTGNPKGVVVSHRALASQAVQMARHFGIQSSDRVMQFASMSFDVFLEQVFAGLVSGATLVVRGAETPPSAELLGQIIAEKITIVNLPTAYWGQVARDWADTPSAVQAPSLKLMIVGGEAMRLEALEAWQQTAFRSIRLLNAYGPTEATITATTFEICGKQDRSIPIGTVVGSRTVYILDQLGNRAAQGVVGELCIGGPLLARGYLNHPGLTAEKFIPDPFSKLSGVRLYRTGDRARFSAAGDIEFIGRVDHQVKIRGFRIELGEVETALDRHPQVEVAVVIVREDTLGLKKLAAYVQPYAGNTLTAESLRSFAEEHLPGHMVPAAFVIIEKFPLNVNGKVDYRALPIPAEAVGTDEPQNAMEKTLSNLWAQVLRVPTVGVQDNFFALGGDSIMAIQIIARAARAGIRITAKEFYQHQTVAALSRIADDSTSAAGDQGDVCGDVPLTPAQHLFFADNPIDPHFFNQSFLFETPAGTCASAMRKALTQLMSHHDALRMKFVRSNSGWRQINTPSAETVDFMYLDLSKLETEAQRQEIEKVALQTQGGLDLESGRLIQAVQFELGYKEPGRLLIVIHHLVVDAVSWYVLLEDLQRAYEQIMVGGQIEMGTKTTSFKFWAEQLQEHACSPEALSEVEFWRGQLQSHPAALPVDHCEGDNLVAHQATIREALSRSDTESLLEAISKVPGSKTDVPLLAALIRTLCSWSDSDRLLVAIERHGREQIIENVDLSRTVGWFTSIFPMQFTHYFSDRPGDTLKRTKQLLARAPHGGVGYGVLRFCGPQETQTLLQGPEPQVSFNYLGRFDQVNSGASFFQRMTAVGKARSPRAPARYLFDINAAILNGALQVDWTFNTSFHSKETAVELTACYVDELKQQIHACSLEHPKIVPGLPAVQLTQRELARAMSQIGKL